MLSYYVPFRPMTPAQRAGSARRQARIFAALIRTPRAISTKGCGYSIQVGGDVVYRTAEVLRANLILHEKAYRITAGGRAEEVFP